MRRDRRTLALASGGVLVAVLVAIGVLLARDRGEAQPVPARDASPATTGPAATEDARTPPDSGGTQPEPAADAVQLSGTDPVTGKKVSLGQFEGMPVVLNFWASWCPPCRDELPALVRLADKHPEAAVVGVNEQDAADAARALQEEIGWTFPSVADPNAKIARRLGVVGMPTTFFLDARHVIVATVTGGTDLAGFEKGLELAERSP